MTEKIRIAVPSMAPGGLGSEMSGHFGHADCFTLVDLDGKIIVDTRIIPNPPHAESGCMAPVQLLKENGIRAIIVGGLGARPMMGFNQVGIRVIAGASGTVETVLRKFLAGQLETAGDDIICAHSKTGDCHH